MSDGTPLFVKQLGSNPIGVHLKLYKGNNPDEWPEDLRVRQWPGEGDDGGS